jgi:hypothetical protein
MIPKIVHYVWVGPKPFPADAQATTERWRRLLPGFEFRLWTEANIDFTPLFVRQAYGVRAYNRVANYARMQALTRFGGIYMDHDVELLQPLDPLLAHACFAGFQTADPTHKDQVNTAILGCEPGHWLAREMLAELDALDGSREVGSDTGPGLLTRVLTRKGPLVAQDAPFDFHGITLYPRRAFYPYEWFETFDPACIAPDTIAVHHWAHLWKRSPTLADRLKLKALRWATRLSPERMASRRRAENVRLRGLA